MYISVMNMQCVITLLDHTLVTVNLDTREMVLTAKVIGRHLQKVQNVSAGMMATPYFIGLCIACLKRSPSIQVISRSNTMCHILKDFPYFLYAAPMSSQRTKQFCPQTESFPYYKSHRMLIMLMHSGLVRNKFRLRLVGHIPKWESLGITRNHSRPFGWSKKVR